MDSVLGLGLVSKRSSAFSLHSSARPWYGIEARLTRLANVDYRVARTVLQEPEPSLLPSPGASFY
jgi:hypothetical protein